MKINVELDTSIPLQNKILCQLLDAANASTTEASQSVAPAVDTRIATDVPSATPLSDIRAKLTALFNAAYAVEPDAAMRVAEQCRTEFGADNNCWTEAQWKIALTRIESVSRF